MILLSVGILNVAVSGILALSHSFSQHSSIIYWLCSRYLCSKRCEKSSRDLLITTEKIPLKSPKKIL